MITYCDSINIITFFSILKNYKITFFRPPVVVYVLEPIPDRILIKILIKILSMLGIDVIEKKFFAGDLRTVAGKSVYLEARRLRTEVSDLVAKRIFNNSSFLSDLNTKWQRNTIYKFIARNIEVNIFELILRCMIVSSIEGEKNKTLIVKEWDKIDTDIIRKFIPDVEVQFYKAWWPKNLLTHLRGFAILYYLLDICRKMRWEKYKDNNGLESFLHRGEPSLLLFQDDDFSADRSIRTQPHWFNKEKDKLSYQTLILKNDVVDRKNEDIDSMKKHGFFLISPQQAYLSSKHSKNNRINYELNKDIRKCILKSIIGKTAEVRFVSQLLQLFIIAKDMDRLCSVAEVKTFMSCENYTYQVNAMHLISPYLNITTISYQYSNMGIVPFNQFTTSDKMILFSKLFENRWRYGSISSQQYLEMGYVFDGSFDHVKKRADTCRMKLKEAGARFIICYLDENVSSTKYGLVSTKDHCDEIIALLTYVLQNSSVGLIVKSQFNRNSPNNFKRINNILSRVISTGRYIELQNSDCSRNSIFPAEAGLASDIAIGHSIGATASLEVALTGTRSIMLDRYNYEGEDTHMYKSAGLLYPSIDEALKKIDKLRNEGMDYNNTGDWGDIIHKFDSFRDGQAGVRLKEFLNKTMQSTEKIMLKNHLPVDRGV